ncbi:MAG TPA: 3-deoxy-manno-octulosonate cytidylyltransferase [Planctomycetota bacterium]|nr:3-deoxy-manno-octulosonate cytidylyltransferase [Planctomycetota bacterium]
MPVALIIPARLSSTRLPRKMLLSDTGKPLLTHTVERALQIAEHSGGLVTRVVVAIDDESLRAAASVGAAEVKMTDPNHKSGTDRIAEAAAKLPEEIIVNLQGDEPLMPVDNALTACRLLTQGGHDAPMGTLVTPLVAGKDDAAIANPAVVKCVIGYGPGWGNLRTACALYFSRHSIPFVRPGDGVPPSPRCYQHLGIYAYRREFLLGYGNLPPSRLETAEKLEQLRALEAGYRIAVAVVKTSPLGIDTPEEYRRFVETLKSQTS